MTVKRPIVADDIFLITGRGHVLTASPENVPGIVEIGDVVCFTSNNPRVIDHEFFAIDRSYKVNGIEVVRTCMYPPSVKGYGFQVSQVKEESK